MTERKNSLHVGRFERRIVFAIAIAAIVPLVTSLTLGYVGFREILDLAFNARVSYALDRAVSTQGELIAAVRDRASVAALAVARDPSIDEADSPLPSALGDAVTAVARVPESVPSTSPAPGSCDEDPAVVDHVAEPIPTLVFRCRSIHGALLDVTTEAPPDLYDGLREIGEIRTGFEAIAANAQALALMYLLVAAGLLLFVIVLAMSAAILLSRRVTRRITLLSDATERVGSGDLTVSLPEGERDEVGDLVRAFNAMVGDLRSTRDRVEYLERVGAWQEMARRLAHEIKNPLTPIQLAVQQAHQSYKADDARFKKVLDDTREIVDEEVQTLRRLVSEFSEFARLPVPELVPHELRDLARDAVRALDPVALRAAPSDRPAPALHLELVETPVPVRADAEVLRRCLDNLVRNAVQAIDLEGGSVVVVAVRSDDESAILEVRDDGPGVPSEARERIFQPYFTTKKLGTGLGLAIVKKAVLEHSGSIECVAAPEGGACFRVRLPLAVPSRRESA